MQGRKRREIFREGKHFGLWWESRMEKEKRENLLETKNVTDHQTRIKFHQNLQIQRPGIPVDRWVPLSPPEGKIKRCILKSVFHLFWSMLLTIEIISHPTRPCVVPGGQDTETISGVDSKRHWLTLPQKAVLLVLAGFQAAGFWGHHPQRSNFQILILQIMTPRDCFGLFFSPRTHNSPELRGCATERQIECSVIPLQGRLQ